MNSIEHKDGPIKEYAKSLDQAVANVIGDVREFQEYYGLLDKSIYGFLPEENMKMKLGHIKEEFDEIIKAYGERDLAEVTDGLIDLIYVAGGLLTLMNLPVEQLWTDVHIRNMAKVRATKETVGKRGSTFDVVKPAGWTGPRTQEIIEYYRPEND